jgi:hypothetical protein
MFCSGNYRIHLSVYNPVQGFSGDKKNVSWTSSPGWNPAEAPPSAPESQFSFFSARKRPSFSPPGTPFYFRSLRAPDGPVSARHTAGNPLFAQNGGPLNCTVKMCFKCPFSKNKALTEDFPSVLAPLPLPNFRACTLLIPLRRRIDHGRLTVPCQISFIKGGRAGSREFPNA